MPSCRDLRGSAEEEQGNWVGVPGWETPGDILMPLGPPTVSSEEGEQSTAPTLTRLAPRKGQIPDPAHLQITVSVDDYLKAKGLRHILSAVLLSSGACTPLLQHRGRSWLAKLL